MNAIARLALLPLRVQMSSEDSMSMSESLKEIQGSGVRKLTKTIKYILLRPDLSKRHEPDLSKQYGGKKKTHKVQLAGDIVFPLESPHSFDRFPTGSRYPQNRIKTEGSTPREAHCNLHILRSNYGWASLCEV